MPPAPPGWRRAWGWLLLPVAETGLPAWTLVALVASSSTLFLLWGVPLWQAPRESSHLARFAVSYLAVIPAAALLLLGFRAFRWSRLATVCGLSWAVKMMITASLYNVVAPGTATSLQPRQAPVSLSPPRAQDRYQPARGEFARGEIEGTIRRGGRPARAAVVALRPRPGLPLPFPSSRELAVRGSTYVTPFAVALLGDALTARNDDAALHTLRLTLDGRLVATHPLPPSGGAVPVPIRRPGLYRLSCANHRSEDGWLLALDHPYSVEVGADGRFRMGSIPAGPLVLAALSIQPDGLWRSEVAVEVSAGSARDVFIDLEAGQPVAAPANP